MTQTIEAQARDLWDRWVTELALPTDAAEHPFYDRADALLDEGQLNAVVTALFDLVPPVADEVGLHRLVQACQQLAQSVELTGVEASDADVVVHGQLVAVTMGGAVDQLTLDANFWPLIESFLHEKFITRAKRQLGQPLTLEILPMATLLHAEACAQLQMDSMRHLAYELVGEPGVVSAQLAQHQRHLQAERTGEVAMGQRLALAVIVYDPAQFPDDEDLADWLQTLDPTDPAWLAHMPQETRWVLPPTDLVHAMGQTLWNHLRMGVDLSRAQHGLSMESKAVDWGQVEEDEATGLVTFHPVAEGAQRLAPIEVSGAWLSLVGPEGVKDILAMWQARDEEPTVVVDASPVARRRTLH